MRKKKKKKGQNLDRETVPGSICAIEIAFQAVSELKGSDAESMCDKLFGLIAISDSSTAMYV